MRLMFTMSPSTAACDRGFSAMNAIKNIHRIRMGDDTLSTSMRMDETVNEFDATPAIKKWLGSTKNPCMILQKQEHHHDGNLTFTVIFVQITI